MRFAKNRRELLEDVITYYNLNNRGINDFGGCSYLTKDNKKCAIGKHVKESVAEELNGENASLNRNNFKLLPYRMKRMGLNFLNDIQGLHDTEKYWNSKGLSKLGLARVGVIRDTYNLH